MQNVQINFAKDVCRLSGEITFNNVMSLYRQTHRFFVKSAKVNFDFSCLKAVDSAAVALLIEWIKLAKDKHAQVKFANLPKNILLLIQIGGIESLLAKYILN